MPTLITLSVLGIYFTAKCGFWRFKAIKKTIGALCLSLKEKPTNGISPFSALATALGGTVGIGSIVGVGYAVSVGGAGSVFWMWVCSFFGMGLKYAEIKIALNRKQGKGGAPFRLADLGYRRMAIVFCVLCILASFGTGNLTQSGAIASFLTNQGVSPIISAVLCCGLIAIAVFGGNKRIAKINSILVPLASGVYLLLCLCIIIINRNKIGSSLAQIFQGALGLSSLWGGFSGAMLSTVIREGFARSLFSNEAGMGSSPLAYGSVTGNVKVQAQWGLFEIFFDSFLVSTVTALCMLSSGFTDATKSFASVFGKVGVLLMGILIAVFAFASVISWCYYALCCLGFLTPHSNLTKFIYKALFSLTAIAGAYISSEVIWDIADVLNGLMLFPNLFLLFKCRNEIERI